MIARGLAIGSDLETHSTCQVDHQGHLFRQAEHRDAPFPGYVCALSTDKSPHAPPAVPARRLSSADCSRSRMIPHGTSQTSVSWDPSLDVSQSSDRPVPDDQPLAPKQDSASRSAEEWHTMGQGTCILYNADEGKLVDSGRFFFFQLPGTSTGATCATCTTDSDNNRNS